MTKLRLLAVVAVRDVLFLSSRIDDGQLIKRLSMGDTGEALARQAATALMGRNDRGGFGRRPRRLAHELTERLRLLEPQCPCQTGRVDVNHMRLRTVPGTGRPGDQGPGVIGRMGRIVKVLSIGHGRQLSVNIAVIPYGAGNRNE